MIKEILKIIPKIDTNELNKMEKGLNARFKRVASRFGKGLGSILKGGALAAGAAALVGKLVNPLKETQEAIDRTLEKSDDIATNAKLFQTSAGNLFKLIQLGNATGLDQTTLFDVLNKFTTKVSEAKLNPDQPSVVRNFTSNPDQAENFINFLKGVQKLSPAERNQAQKQVFGEAEVLKLAEFSNLNFDKKIKALGFDKISSKKLSDGINKMGDLSDLKGEMRANIGTQDILTKSGLINSGMIRDMMKSEKIALDKENKRIASYDDMKKLALIAQEIDAKVDQGIMAVTSAITTVVTKIEGVITRLDGLKSSPMYKGLMRLIGRGE